MGKTIDKYRLPRLGMGIGFREELRSGLFRNRAAAGWLELIADHYLFAPPRKSEELALLKDHFPLVPHGIHLSIGSAEGPDPRYLEALARLIDDIDPPWWSEHLAFTRGDGRHIGHLAPLPWTREAVETVARNVEAVRRFIDRPLILENITYMVKLPGAEMEEYEFLNAVVEATGCGLLLDLTNVVTNGHNHHYDPSAFIRRLPLDHVVQVHVVGGHREGDLLVDSHSAPVPETVWQLLDELLGLTPLNGVLLERDEHIPAFAELVPELDRGRAILQTHAT